MKFISLGEKKILQFSFGVRVAGSAFPLPWNKEPAATCFYFPHRPAIVTFNPIFFSGDEPGEYYVISWNEEEATFQANLYGYNVSYGEGGKEIYDDEVTCIDTNCFELSALSSDVIIGNIHE